MTNKQTIIAVALAAAGFFGANLLGANSQSTVDIGGHDVPGQMVQLFWAAVGGVIPWAANKFNVQLPSVSTSTPSTVTELVDHWQALNTAMQGSKDAEKALDELWEIIGQKTRETTDAKTPA